MDFKHITLAYRGRRVGIIGEKSEYKRFSVMIPIIEQENGLNILFEVRSKSLRHQPGEISLPGGKIEEDESSRNAAVRETCEELGLQPPDIEVLGRNDVLVTQHNRIIYPYICRINNMEKLNPSLDEVDHIFLVPVEYFARNKPEISSVRIITVPDQEFPFSEMMKANEYKWYEGKNNIYFYRYNDYIIWGITAKIIHSFINIITSETGDFK